MTILFCDLRNFTALAEGMDARALTSFLNSFLSPMTEIILAEKGTIDRYLGDGIMAFWNAPLDDPDHAKNAVRAAQAMRQKLVELNRGWEAEARAGGKSSGRSAWASASTPANAASAITARSNISITRCSAIR
jgi:adenylate cyclase